MPAKLPEFREAALAGPKLPDAGAGTALVGIASSMVKVTVGQNQCKSSFDKVQSTSPISTELTRNGFARHGCISSANRHAGGEKAEQESKRRRIKAIRITPMEKARGRECRRCARPGKGCPSSAAHAGRVMLGRPCPADSDLAVRLIAAGRLAASGKDRRVAA